MQPEQMILPTIATLALGTALLVPLRDDRLGKRATIGGTNLPLRPNFGALLGGETVAAPLEEPHEDADASVVVTPERPDTDDERHEHEDVEDDAQQRLVLHDFRNAFTTMSVRVRDFFVGPPKAGDAFDDRLAVDTVAGASDEHRENEGETVVERSFAETLGSLLPLSALEPSAAVVAETTRASHEPQQAAFVATPPVPAPAAEASAIVIAADDVRRNAPVPAFDRVVPLTRMPLRPQAREITWPNFAPGADALASEAQRHAFLSAAIRTPDASLEPALLAAYREEDAQGRLLALRALRSAASPHAGDTFADALHVGTDDERSFAVDALLALGRRDAVTPAFNDRVDAISAQAALGYVGTYRRADYIAELATFVDRARIDAILVLLAGIVE